METKVLDFYKGMDISFLQELLDQGLQMKDFDGTTMEPFDLLNKYGVNAIRLRIWNNPSNVPESKGYCSLSHTIQMAKKIISYGMRFMLDFHYSDYWADPAQQNKPKAWADLSFEELENAVYSYTRETLLSMKEEGVMPDMVQIGNEIRSGLLFPDGELPDYTRMVQLVNAGIRAARSVADANTMKVIIHLDQGGRFFYLNEWFSKAMDHGLLEFDIMGLSYYPFWHGTFMDFKETMEKLIGIYHKPIMIVETAYAWRKSQNPNGLVDESQEKIAGIKASEQGQKQVLDLVMNIVASLPEKMGLGIYYWEPLCIPKLSQPGWSENMGLLDEEGRVMEGIKSFMFTRRDMRGGEYVKVYEPAPVTVRVGEKPIFPEEVSVLCYDGTIEKHHVLWQEGILGSTMSQQGSYQVGGRVDGVNADAVITVRVVSELSVAENLLSDTNWEDGLTQWVVEKSDDEVMVQLYPEFVNPFPAPPLNALRVEALKNFTFQISQQIYISKKGQYILSAEFQGTDTTNVEIRLFAQAKKHSAEVVVHSEEHVWTEFEINDIACEVGVLIVGIRIVAPPIYCMMRKIRLTIKM